MWDLIFQPGIEPVPHALEGQSLNHFTTRDIPRDFILVEYVVIRFDLSRALYETMSRNIKRIIKWIILNTVSESHVQARLQQYMNCELPDVQTGFRKGRGTRDQIANIRWIIKKAGVPEKHLFLLYWLCKNFDCVDHNKLWKILKEI